MTFKVVFAVFVIANFLGSNNAASVDCAIRASNSCPFWVNCKQTVESKSPCAETCKREAKLVNGNNIEIDAGCGTPGGTGTPLNCNLAGTTHTCSSECNAAGCTDYLYGPAAPTPPAATQLQCRQCSSRLDKSGEDCLNSPPPAIDCTGGVGNAKTCVSDIRKVVDINGTLLSTVTFRSCSPDPTVQAASCSVVTTKVANTDDKRTIHCTETCDANNCNTIKKFSPQEYSGLECYATSAYDSSKGKKVKCHKGENYCVHKQIYYSKAGAGKEVGDVFSDERGCAKDPVNTGCDVLANSDSYFLGDTGELTVCQKSCNKSECNKYAFPTGISCSQCEGRYSKEDGSAYYSRFGETDADDANFDYCRDYAPEPTPCKQMSAKSCYVMEKHTSTALGLNPVFKRGCSDEAPPAKGAANPVCHSETYWAGGKSYQNCMFSCGGQGCNYGNFDKSSTATLAASLLTVTVVAIKSLF